MTLFLKRLKYLQVSMGFLDKITGRRLHKLTNLFKTIKSRKRLSQ